MGGSGSQPQPHRVLVGRVVPIDVDWGNVAIVEDNQVTPTSDNEMLQWWAPRDLCNLWWMIAVSRTPGPPCIAVRVVLDARNPSLLTLGAMPLSQFMSCVLGLGRGDPEVSPAGSSSAYCTWWWCPVMWSGAVATVGRPSGRWAGCVALARWERGGSNKDVALCVVWDHITRSRRLFLQQSRAHPHRNVWSPQQPQTQREVRLVDLIWYLVGIPGCGELALTPWDAKDPG